ncbi:MAG: glycosyltransferase family 2 protein [Bacteroidales bacterium]|nr:glycosyltransferase family 2 protein [Bacteroidales bacterium]
MDTNFNIQKPTISIITVTYQAEKEIERTIRSVLEQSYKHIEYIIIDGGSTDGTCAIIDKYRSQLAYFTSEPDHGLYDAMNKGIRNATGEYLWFLNAGDSLYSPDTIKRMINATTSNTFYPDIIYGETALVDHTGSFLRMRRLKAPENLTWESFKMGMVVCHQAFVVKRSLAPEYDLQYKFSSDFDWAIRCLQKAKSIRNCHLTLCNYLEEGITTRNRNASLKERFLIMTRYYGWFTVTCLHFRFAVRFWKAKMKNEL